MRRGGGDVGAWPFYLEGLCIGVRSPAAPRRRRSRVVGLTDPRAVRGDRRWRPPRRDDNGTLYFTGVFGLRSAATILLIAVLACAACAHEEEPAATASPGFVVRGPSFEAGGVDFTATIKAGTLHVGLPTRVGKPAAQLSLQTTQVGGDTARG